MKARYRSDLAFAPRGKSLRHHDDICEFIIYASPDKKKSPHQK